MGSRQKVKLITSGNKGLLHQGVIIENMEKFKPSPQPAEHWESERAQESANMATADQRPPGSNHGPGHHRIFNPCGGNRRLQLRLRRARRTHARPISR